MSDEGTKPRFCALPSNAGLDARYEGCETGMQIAGRTRWLGMQEARDIDAEHKRYCLFWVFKIMEKFPNMPYREAEKEFFTNGTRSV